MLRRRRRVARPVKGEFIGARVGLADQCLSFFISVSRTNALVLGVVFGKEGFWVGQQLLQHGDGARCIGNPHHRAAVIRCDFHRRVHARGGRATDEQWRLALFEIRIALHFGGDVGHFFERRRDQTGQADQVGIDFFGFGEDLRAWDHHTHVFHVKIITLQHHGDDVFADVVDVAFDRGDHDFGLRARGSRVAARDGGGFFGFDKRNQMRHGLLHHAGRFDHLRQEHFALAEQITHHIHAVHQRAFDDLDRLIRGEAAFFGVFVDKLRDAVYQ